MRYLHCPNAVFAPHQGCGFRLVLSDYNGAYASRERSPCSVSSPSRLSQLPRLALLCLPRLPLRPGNTVAGTAADGATEATEGATEVGATEATEGATEGVKEIGGTEEAT